MLISTTVTDHDYTPNKVTAVGAAMKELYLGADNAGNAKIDISSIVAPASAAGKAHLKIVRTGDNQVVFDQAGGSASSVTLHETATANEFAITAWLDANSDGAWQAGEDKCEANAIVFNLNTLTVSDPHLAGNTVQATDAAIKTLYDSETLYGGIDFDATVSYDYDPAQTGKFIKYRIKQGGEVLDQWDGRIGKTLPTKQYTLTNAKPTVTVHAWLDKNMDGAPNADEQVRIVDVDGVRGGKDITDQLKIGGDRLSVQFAKLSTFQQLELSRDLIANQNLLLAWDISTLKGSNIDFGICDPETGLGVNGVKPYRVVTVNGEVFPASCVNYYLFGRIMNLCYYRRLALGMPSSICDFWNLTSTKMLVGLYRFAYSSNLDGAGVDLAVAFAEAGWNANLSCVKGIGIPGAVPCSSKFVGRLNWRAGVKLLAGGDYAILDFAQGPTWDDWQDRPNG